MNAFGWIEIPTNDMQRAIKFYNAVMQWELKAQSFGQLEMAWFPGDQKSPGASGSLVKQELYVPSKEGPLVYFSCNDVKECLDRVPDGGGEVLVEKRLIAEGMGYMGLAMDSEGNRIAFHREK